jgi:hypothetical protein
MIIAEGRSAGIVVVYSLQRITHDCIPTSLRYNLGGILCFGLKNASDTKIVFGSDTPAKPELLKDQYPGTFFLDAKGVDQDKLGNQLMTDRFDRAKLAEYVRDGAKYRTPMDNTTASALGVKYEEYVKNSPFTDMNSVNSSYESMNEPTAEYEKYEEPVKNTRSQNFTSDPAEELNKLYEFIVNLGYETFKKIDVAKPHMEMTGKNNKKTIYDRIEKLVDQGRLVNVGNDTYKVK